MIVGLKPYPAMKDSGVPWLGEVPVHWEARQLGQFGMLLKGSGGTKEDEVPAGIPCVRYGDLYTSHEYFILKARSFVSSAKAKEYTPIKFGDVLFAASGETIEEIGKSAVNLIPSQACCGGDVILFRPNREVDARYLGYGTDCTPSALQKATMGRGVTVMHIYGDQLKRLSMALPPLLEQAAIVRYLDHADRRIQRYIRAKQELIKLQEEQKQALIHQAVTGQIDVRTGQPYPAYKPSGVEWLGDVPEHWEVVALKRVLRRLVDCEHKTAPAVGESDYRVVRTTAVRYGRLRWEGTYCTTATAFRGWTKRGLPKPGDVIFTREAPAGEACVVPEGTAVCLGQRTVLMKPQKGEYDSHFLVHMIYAGPPRDRVRLASQGSTVGHFNMDDIGWMQVLKPPFSEQLKLVKAIRDQTRVLDLAVTRAESETSLLREYRSRLIADVVTGKLDVREAVARLPDEAEEPDPRDGTDALTEGEEGPTDDLDTAPEEAAV